MLVCVPVNILLLNSVQIMHLGNIHQSFYHENFLRQKLIKRTVW